MRVYRVAVLLLLVLFAFRTSENLAQQRRFNLTILNKSTHEIHRLHLSVSGDKSWGPDLLGDDILGPEGSVTRSVPPAYYNLLFIDADYNEYVEINFPVFSDQVFRFDDKWLNDNRRRRN